MFIPGFSDKIILTRRQRRMLSGKSKIVPSSTKISKYTTANKAGSGFRSKRFNVNLKYLVKTVEGIKVVTYSEMKELPSVRIIKTL